MNHGFSTKNRLKRRNIGKTLSSDENTGVNVKTLLPFWTHLLTNLASIEVVTGKDVDDYKQHTHCRIILAFLKPVESQLKVNKEESPKRAVVSCFREFTCNSRWRWAEAAN